MKRFAICVAIIVTVAATFTWSAMPHGENLMADDSTAEHKVVHSVYFTLKDDSSAATKTLVDACYKYLKDIDGIVSFAAGTLAEDQTRPVNDQEFNVGLNVVFKSASALDTYATHPQHLKFIAEGQSNWKKVRVFDFVDR